MSFIIRHYEREFGEKYSLLHHALVESDQELNSYDLEVLAGRCGYDPCGYGMFGSEVKEIKPNLYDVMWRSSSTCD